MKLKIAILTTAIAAVTSMSAFGQGQVLFSGAANSVWDIFNGLGAGVAARSNTVAVAFLWNTTGGTDPLVSAGSNFATNQAPANKQTATNGVFNTSYAGIGQLLAAGWQFATNASSGTLASIGTGVTGNFTYNGGNNFLLANSAGSTTYQFIVVGWNISAGLTAILNGTGIVDFGYSNPFLYTTGADSTSGVSIFSSSGMNRFGVTAVPEPTTFALAGLGIASLLAFRRRNK